MAATEVAAIDEWRRKQPDLPSLPPEYISSSIDAVTATLDPDNARDRRNSSIDEA
jgi:hypothetical protein